MKLLTVVGARPQFVKAAVISRAIKKYPDMREVLVHTGQHYDANMSDVFFDEMEIPKPDYFLGINGLSHGAMTGRMIEEIEKLLIAEKPDYLVVYGDTNSTLAAGLAAKKLGIKTVHIEAGVRNYDELMPEEVNRYLVDRLSALNFCCTRLGVENLRKEGYQTDSIPAKVYDYGDVMYDAVLHYEKKAARDSRALDNLDLRGKDFILCTVHRASNTDDPAVLGGIVAALNAINRETPIVLPIHPRTRGKMASFGITAEFKLIDPVGYLDMIVLTRHCKYVVTDSGGVVREAFFLKKPSLFLLDKPVWPELVEDGFCLNTVPVEARILETFRQLKTLFPDFSKQLYGDGHAGEKIVAEIRRHRLQSNPAR